MPKAKYQHEDFLAIISDDYKGFVLSVHEMLLQEKYKPKVQVTKSTGLQLSYAEPKVKGVTGIILIFFMRGDKLTIRIYGKNHKAYPNVLNNLPEAVVNQIDNADNCVKFTNPEKCWNGCIGYEFHINEKHFQKCAVNCFQFEVDSESMSHLIELIKSESKERMAA